MGEDMKRRRIPRACDRCRLKKSKCDGGPQCSPCRNSDSACVFRTRRIREAKDYYWHMREIENEALQRLYWACRKGSNFPGLLPDETDGAVTTHAILRGLGLIGPEEDEFVLQELLKRPSTYDDKQGKPRQPTPPSSPQSASPSDDSRGSSSRSNSFDMQICDLPEQMLHNFTPAAGSPIGVTVSPPQRLQSQSLGANQRAVYTAVPTQPLPAPVPLNTNMMASQFFDFESASATGLDELFYQDLMQWPVAPNSGVFPMQG